jgi:hypothetical protein
MKGYRPPARLRYIARDDQYPLSDPLKSGFRLVRIAALLRRTFDDASSQANLVMATSG